MTRTKGTKRLIKLLVSLSGGASNCSVHIDTGFEGRQMEETSQKNVFRFSFPTSSKSVRRSLRAQERNVEIGLQIGNLFVMPYIPVWLSNLARLPLPKPHRYSERVKAAEGEWNKRKLNEFLPHFYCMMRWIVDFISLLPDKRHRHTAEQREKSIKLSHEKKEEGNALI